MNSFDQFQLDFKAVKALTDERDIVEYIELFDSEVRIDDDLFCENDEDFDTDSYYNFLVNELENWNRVEIYIVSSNAGEIVRQVKQGTGISFEIDREIYASNSNSGKQLRNSSKLKVDLMQDRSGRFKISNIKRLRSDMRVKKVDFKKNRSIYSSSFFSSPGSFRNLSDQSGSFQIVFNPKERERRIRGLNMGVRRSLKEIDFFKSLKLGLEFEYGGGLARYQSVIKADSVQTAIELEDSEGDSFFRITSAKDIDESIQLDFIFANLGLTVLIGKENIKHLQWRINFSTEIWYNFNSIDSINGSFTYSASYPQFNLSLTDIPELGYVTDMRVSSDISLKPEVWSFFGSLNTGFRYHMFHESLYFEAGIRYRIPFMKNFIKGDSNNEVSPEIGAYGGVVSSTNISWPNRMMLEFAIGFQIKRRWKKQTCKL